MTPELLLRQRQGVESLVIQAVLIGCYSLALTCVVTAARKSPKKRKGIRNPYARVTWSSPQKPCVSDDRSTCATRAQYINFCHAAECSFKRSTPSGWVLFSLANISVLFLNSPSLVNVRTNRAKIKTYCYSKTKAGSPISTEHPLCIQSHKWS